MLLTRAPLGPQAQASCLQSSLCSQSSSIYKLARAIASCPSPMHGQLLRRTGSLQTAAGKGFGSTKAPASDRDNNSNKPKARQRKRQLAPTLPGQQQQREQEGNTAFQAAVDLSKRQEQELDNAEFAERLKALKAEGMDRKARLGSPAPAASSSGSPAPGSPAPAAFDLPPENIYANPPTISDTLMSQLNADVSDPKLREAQFGPSQLGIAAGAVIFGLVFVLVSGADFAPNNRFKGVRSAVDMPDTVEQGIIKTRISNLEEQLKVTPGDPETTQALALSYAQLLNYDKAANLLDKLVAKQPNSPDAWRLLGETSLLAEQAQRAVKAYERAIALRNDDLQIATGMVDAYIANAQYGKAVAYLSELKTRTPDVSALGVVAVDARAQEATNAASSSEASSSDAGAEPPAAEGAESAAPVQPSTTAASSRGAATASGSGSAPIRPLEPVSVELLLAKTYSAWRGHDNDALATYDALIQRFPEDFRGYLAKGVFLRDKGRRADAERMFLQARFYAPENRQRFVKETAETKPVVDLPEQ